ncbi:hypothetical protein [Winogradskyella immobilis]|uniref:DUF3857 domain-containing protein n=1 Tax=Winogradskyella immobilis TaxID=2816852 RepID=A0ABS8ENS9_9FLAO|nr:hypothetical protein [Winogradskyella immobilis]MCC1484813.1 hypothetical protein [Winogradskyella immobilis]MCG0016905.1 hypothetical protein [Winogradskyella immobilis]
MKIFFLLCILLKSINLFSQKFEDQLKVTKADLEMNFYDKDSTANAVVIYEYGITSINRSRFNLTQKVNRKIKLFNKNGFENGNVSIILFGNGGLGETIRNLEATTYNIENDSIIATKLKDDQIFVENFDGLSTIVKFTLPNLKEGSVITYKYEVISPFIYKFKPWYFQDDIPKITSEYLSSIPIDWTYNTKLVGGLTLSHMDKMSSPKCVSESFFTSSKVSACENILFQLNDVPPFISESFLSSKDNYISKLDYELESIKLPDGKIKKFSNNWEIVDTQIKESNTGELLKKRGYLKSVIPKDISEITDQYEKAKAIYEYVINAYTWNNNNRSINDNLKPLTKTKSGSVYEINSLLYNVLNLNDIDASPMLISTRDNGLPTKLYPVITDFNYLIVRVKIDDKIYYLDATDKYVPFGELPFRCLNQYGRIMDFENLSTWEDINISKYSLHQKRVELSFNDDGVFNGKLENKTTGFPSQDIRKAYFEDEDIYLDVFKNAFTNINIEDHKVNTVNKSEDQFNETIEFTYEPDFINNKIYFNPFLFKFFKENPFRLKERNYPIDFGYKDIYQFSAEIYLKDHLKIIEIPKPVNIIIPNKSGSFLFTCKQEGNKLMVFLKIKFDKPIYGAEYYEALKNFMSKVVEVQNNTIVVLEKQ